MATGYNNLRALLDDAKFSAALHNFGGSGNVENNLNKYDSSLQGAFGNQRQLSHNNAPACNSKETEPAKGNKSGATAERPNASLQLADDAWYSGGGHDFDLEYMDLDQFLVETGLVDTNFNLANSRPNSATPLQLASTTAAVAPQPLPPPIATVAPQPSTSPQSGVIEQLLLRGNPRLTRSPLSTPSPGLQLGSPLRSPPRKPSPPQSCGQASPQQSPLQTGFYSHASPQRNIQLGQTSPNLTRNVSLEQQSPQQNCMQLDADQGKLRPIEKSLKNHEEVEQVAEDEESKQPSEEALSDTATKIVKKRKYSEDGEGLTDTTVIVVPGQDGFDPACAKFTPEDLQPQPIIKKSRKQFVPEDNKDEKYWKRRNKNNVAAKRSREARRAKENQIIMRAGFLESENSRLTSENSELLAENEKLKELVKQLQCVQMSPTGSH